MEAGQTLEIDAAELQKARADRRVTSLLQAAAAEGARVRSEGRERWAATDDGLVMAEEIEEARSDPRVADVIKAAAAEGARVEREGRQRW